MSFLCVFKIDGVIKHLHNFVFYWINWNLEKSSNISAHFKGSKMLDKILEILRLVVFEDKCFNWNTLYNPKCRGRGFWIGEFLCTGRVTFSRWSDLLWSLIVVKTPCWKQLKLVHRENIINSPALSTIKWHLETWNYATTKFRVFFPEILEIIWYILMFESEVCTCVRNFKLFLS